MLRFRAFVYLIVALASPFSAAAPPPDAAAAIRDAGRTWLLDNDGVGLSIGVFVDNQRHFYNFGATQIDGNKPPTKDTIYEIGGISRTFAGQLLARAIIEGRATLEDEIDKYLDEPYPNLATGSEKIRLLHLVNSTSHLADNIPDLTQLRGVPDEPLTVTRMRALEKYSKPEFLAQLHHVRPQRAPGDDPVVSNVGAMLLGVALEKIHGEAFENILAREIEKPLRMASGTSPPAKLLARGYTDANVALPPFGAKMQFAASTLRYSADDLLKFCAWQMVERDASVKLAHQPAWSRPNVSLSLGFHWLMGESAQGRRLFSTGVTYGFASLCDQYPDAKVAVVLLANKSAAGAQENLRALSAKIVGLLRPSPGGEAVSPPSSAVAPRQDR
jgi:CubicO group peptidase (beta-lactamase class C family)